MTETRARARALTAADLPAGLDLVPLRRIVRRGLDVHIRLHPGDRVLVDANTAVEAGAPIVERLRDPVPIRVDAPEGARPGDRLPRDGSGDREVELLHPVERGAWRAVGAKEVEVITSPVEGTVRGIVPGSRLTLEANGIALAGVTALGGLARGRLELVGDAPSRDVGRSVDVNRAGTVLVLGPRADAEILTRARAMGVRGVVVAGLGGKERRDLAASERRQRAGIHGLSPFAVLVLDGAIRRPIASPVWAVLEGLVGHEVALVNDPPALVCWKPPRRLPQPAPDLVRVRHGALAGAEGRFAGLAGPRRFAAGLVADAGLVELGSRDPVPLPLGDLERFV